LLGSLKSQTVAPEEVLVVLPEGYALPDERLGTERFVRSRKGAVLQRWRGIQAARGDFLLVCDDDVCFDSRLVETLHRTHARTGAEIVIPVITSAVGDDSLTWGGGLKRMRDLLCGVRRLSSKPSEFCIRIWGTGGYIKNGRIEKGRQYYLQSGHGSCAFLKRRTAEVLGLQDEAWLDEARYPLPDDQVMFYKAYLQGSRIAWCQEARVLHLNGADDIRARAADMAYANGRNFTIFWHRFLYHSNANAMRKIDLMAGLALRVFNTSFYYAALYLFNPKSAVFALSLYRGYIDAVRYLRTDAYRRLPAIEDRRTAPGSSTVAAPAH